MSLTSSYLGDQEDLVLQGTQVLGSPLPHSVQGGLQSVREGDKLTFPIKSLPPRLLLSKLLIYTLKKNKSSKRSFTYLLLTTYLILLMGKRIF